MKFKSSRRNQSQVQVNFMNFKYLNGYQSIQKQIQWWNKVVKVNYCQLQLEKIFKVQLQVGTNWKEIAIAFNQLVQANNWSINQSTHGLVKEYHTVLLISQKSRLTDNVIEQ